MILDHNGNPIGGVRFQNAQRELMQIKREIVKAKYDVAQTVVGNERHWLNADNLDPHAANSVEVRKRLRSRSRYEVIENNPFLKGTVLTIANDFVGSGPKLQITDTRISKERRRIIEKRFAQWSKKVRFRQKLWRVRIGKLTDGEGFMFAYNKRRTAYPVKLNFFCVEPDQVSSDAIIPNRDSAVNQIDGIRFDEFLDPIEYHLLNEHPGSRHTLNFRSNPIDGKWVKDKFVIHWFRQERGWLRGIPETTPSLPLCALLRRYTLAVVRQKELHAMFSAILETEAPPNQAAWTDGDGNQLVDDPFDVFPVEHGMITTMPWGYTMKQLDSVPDGTLYDDFVGSILREITRPLLTPFNIAVGTSKDSNMASAVVDQHIYKGGQEAERTDCEEAVLEKVLFLWWLEASRVRGYLGDNLLSTDNTFKDDPPEHVWRWDKIGLEHTDPAKVANALKTLHEMKFVTDRDIQESWFNRDVEDWREEIIDQEEFREKYPAASFKDTQAGEAEESSENGSSVPVGEPAD